MDVAESRAAYEILTERHRAGSMIVTSNRGADEWLATFADPMRAQSAIDRFSDNAYDLIVEGESYRSRQKPSRGGRRHCRAQEEAAGEGGRGRPPGLWAYGFRARGPWTGRGRRKKPRRPQAPKPALNPQGPQPRPRHIFGPELLDTATGLRSTSNRHALGTRGVNAREKGG
jgi:hypothetical protein